MNPRHLVLIIGVIVVWGLNFVAVKTALQEIPPIFLCFLRFLLCLPMLFFTKRPPAPFKKIAAYSILTFVLQFSLLFSGMRTGISAGLASVLLQFQSFFAIGFAILFLGEKFHLWQGVGAAVGFLGIALVATHIGGGDATFGGLFLVLAAAMMWAAGSLLAKKMDQASGFSLVVWSSLLACPPLLILSYLVEGPEAIVQCVQNLQWIYIISVSYIAFFSTLFGFGIWNWLLRFYPLSKVAPFTLLVPIVGMLGSFFILGEPLLWWKIASAGLILSGLSINLYASRIQSTTLQLKPSVLDKK